MKMLSELTENAKIFIKEYVESDILRDLNKTQTQERQLTFQSTFLPLSPTASPANLFPSPSPVVALIADDYRLLLTTIRLKCVGFVCAVRSLYSFLHHYYT